MGGSSPDVPVTMAPEARRWFHHHSSRIESDGLRWVAASGFEGAASIAITLDANPAEQRLYTVRLHFAEQEETASGLRVFDVSVQGVKRLSNLDIVA